MVFSLRQLVAGLLSSLGAMGVYFVVILLSGGTLTLPQQIMVIGLVFLCIGVPIFSKISTWHEEKIKEKYKPQLIKEFHPRIQKEVLKNLEADSGIVRVFPNFAACEDEILEQTKKARDIKVFIQMGKTLAVGKKSYYEVLSETKLQPNAKIRILHASQSSPYLSEDKARRRGSHFQEWRTKLNHAEEILSILSERKDLELDFRQHCEGFLWRLFIFDGLAYVHPYLYDRDNSEKAPVLKFAREFSSEHLVNPHSMFNLFNSYFDCIWLENESGGSGCCEGDESVSQAAR